MILTEQKRWMRYTKRGMNQYEDDCLLDVNSLNQVITTAITNNHPFFAGRFGQTEMNLIYAVMEHRIFPFIDHRKGAVNQLCQNAGFFPNKIDDAEQFCDLMLQSCKEVDVQGVWNLRMEKYIMERYAVGAQVTKLMNLSPWIQYKCEIPVFNPWSAALEGKKVLVIHPFSDSIERQYQENREKIFSKMKDQVILPEFQLMTLKAVQTISNTKDERFATWFDALEWMINECRNRDFDIAIIGCGAYGYPLSAEIKKMGKVAIHLAGATQILFGIIGKRWEEKPDFMKSIPNEFWIHPSENEKPPMAGQIENGCYW